MMTWNTSELADILEVSVSTVRGWVGRGLLKATKFCCREGNRIRTDELMKFLDSRPKYKQRFADKLTHAMIGEKLSSSVIQLLKREGYLE